MPIYVHNCRFCDHEFDVFASVAKRLEASECPKCKGVDSELVIKAVGINFPGDDWATKNNRVQGQMRQKNNRLKSKSRERNIEQPVATLVPNVGGERVESWGDAKALARDKGKETKTYDAMIRRENKVKTA